MKLDDSGCFFIKRKTDKSIWVALYYKTNYLLKKHPHAKITMIDEKTKKFKDKPYSRNRVFIAFFDKHGRDYIAMKDFTYKETEQMIENDAEEIYDCNDYTSALDLYTKMKETGLSKFYTKKWVEHNYEFVKGQLEKM